MVECGFCRVDFRMGSMHRACELRDAQTDII